MPNYNLLIVDEGRILATVAADCEGALADFSEQLDKRLTLNPQDDPTPASYLLDEWHEGPHWVNPTIPVFEFSN